MNIFSWLFGGKEDDDKVDLSRRNLFGQAAGAALAAPLVAKAVELEGVQKAVLSPAEYKWREELDHEVHYDPEFSDFGCSVGPSFGTMSYVVIRKPR
jgi:hypothetical protein